MPGKGQIVAELGDLLLPNLVNTGLTANDRAKYLMTLLQTAREQADHPDGGVTNLKQERTACGIEESVFDTVVQQSSHEGHGVYRVPNVERVHAQIVDNLKEMLAPLRMAVASMEGDETRAAEYERRLERLAAGAPSLAGDLISGDYIAEITSTQPTSGDSFHLLVMNLHKELNRLQQQIAAETIDGACVYGVTDADRRLIAAFMRGVNRTRKLKFDHPGLDTTATRTADELEEGLIDERIALERLSEYDLDSLGILTMLGGRTSHVAVVARQMNKVCIVGCRDLVIERNGRCRIGAESFSERDYLSLDGHSGAIYSGQLEVVAEKPVELLAVVNQWRQQS